MFVLLWSVVLPQVGSLCSDQVVNIYLVTLNSRVT